MCTLIDRLLAGILPEALLFWNIFGMYVLEALMMATRGMYFMLMELSHTRHVM
jgi:hypothetical protein